MTYRCYFLEVNNIVIHESNPWKLDLRRRLRLIKKYNAANRFESDYESTYAVIEMCVFYSAFIIRKLFESVKLSDEAERYNFQAIGIKPIKQINRMNNWPDENSHDWEKEICITITGKELCNRLLHSYVFFLEFEESGSISSFCISSDYDRNKILYKIALDDWISYMNFIATDSITESSMHYDRKVQDYVVKFKKRNYERSYRKIEK